MNFNDLRLLVDNKDAFLEFFASNKQEIVDYIDASKSNKPKDIPLDFMDVGKPITQKDLITLLEFYLKGYLLEWDLEYILNSLDGCDIEDEKVEEVIFNFGNPYLNYHISIENVNRAIRYLKNEMLNLQLDGVDIKSKQQNKDYRPNYKSKVFGVHP